MTVQMFTRKDGFMTNQMYVNSELVVCTFYSRFVIFGLYSQAKLYSHITEEKIYAVMNTT